MRDFLAESQTDQDIELRSSSCGRGVRANRIVLAAVSPFFKMCLADAVTESGQVTITITDCCYESLTYVMHYIHHGDVTTTDQVMRDKVQALISRLQIGDFSISHLEKFESLESMMSGLIMSCWPDRMISLWDRIMSRPPLLIIPRPIGIS